MKSIAEVMDESMTRMQQSRISSYSTCPKCGGKTEIIIELLGKKRKMPVTCKCKQEEYNKEREMEQRQEQQRRLERLRKHSLMDSKFENCTFGNWKTDKQNEKWYKLGKKYCEKWNEMKAKNMGLLLWGPPGTGKTYLTSCIANELLDDLVPVIAISSIGLLNRIKETYNTFGQEGEIEIIKTLKNAELLILDDLGAENGTDWAKSKLYEIIDSRCRDEKPMIASTNLTPTQLREKLTTEDKVTRTYDRLIEMCILLEVKGNSKRIEYANDKAKKLKDLLG